MEKMLSRQSSSSSLSSLSQSLSLSLLSPLRLRFLVIGSCLSLIFSAFLIFGFRSNRDYYGGGGDNSFFLKKSSSSSCTPASSYPNNSSSYQIENHDNWEFITARDGDNYGLSDEQCQITFPKLFVEIDKSVEMRINENKPITWKELNSRKLGDGMVRAIVDRGELYIIAFGDMPYTYSRAKATLHSLHRALVAFPNRAELPSVEFIFSAEDFVDDDDDDGDDQPTKGPIWAYSKRDGDDSVWLMPDFGYWSWPEVRVGPYRDIRRRIAAVDDGLVFQEKKKQLLWRGSLATAPEVRGNLLAAARGKHWASVRIIDWDDNDNNNNNNNNDILPMEEHCRHMFLAHTEGRSFSGRGKYLHNCRSVIMSHKLIWREAHHAALMASGPEANYIEVSRDFADLEQKIEFLLDHPDVAERIANNSVATFRDRYLTPAAEACYWRYLIRRYAEVCDFVPDLYQSSSSGVSQGKERKKLRRGVPYEDWLLTGLM